MVGRYLNKNCLNNVITLIGFMFLFSCSSNEGLFIASGAGYKKPVVEICNKFSRDSGIKINTIFGNMQTLSTQAMQSDQIGLLIGNQSFLESSAVPYDEYTLLGNGKLVLAYPKDIRIQRIDDLIKPGIQRISMPDTVKAIYGKAAQEYLDNNGYWEPLQEKIFIIATVPMVSSYLMSGEIDAGFINLTEAIGIEKKIGGYLVLEEGYSPIKIVAGTIQGFKSKKMVRRFIAYLQSNEAIQIFKKFGL